MIDWNIPPYFQQQERGGVNDSLEYSSIFTTASERRCELLSDVLSSIFTILVRCAKSSPAVHPISSCRDSCCFRDRPAARNSIQQVQDSYKCKYIGSCRDKKPLPLVHLHCTLSIHRQQQRKMHSCLLYT